MSFTVMLSSRESFGSIIDYPAASRIRGIYLGPCPCALLQAVCCEVRAVAGPGASPSGQAASTDLVRPLSSHDRRRCKADVRGWPYADHPRPTPVVVVAANTTPTGGEQ